MKSMLVRNQALGPIQPPSRAAWEHQASRRDMKRGYPGLMVHQVMLPVTYFSAPAAIHFLAIPVHPALHQATDSTTADTVRQTRPRPWRPRWAFSWCSTQSAIFTEEEGMLRKNFITLEAAVAA